MFKQSLSIFALILALVALGASALGMYQNNATHTTLEKSLAALKPAMDRIGVAPLDPAKSMQAKNVARDASRVPPPIMRTEPITVQVNLTTYEVTAEIADGTTFTFWTFDGTVPGPLIRVMEGDTVKLDITNAITSTMSHNIDLHAVNGPGGGAGVTKVSPGETKTFTFKALNVGAYIYHCAATPPYVHVAQGMYGGIVVEPKGGLPKVDREFYVVQGEWYTSGSFGDKGHQDLNGEKARAEHPEYYTFNGHVDALTKYYPLQAKVGETVRVFFGVGGPNIASNFHIIGEIFDKVYSGAPQTFVGNEETWVVPPGSMSIMEFKLNEPGQYLLVDHALWRVAKGASGLLMVTGNWDNDVFMPRADGSSH